MLRTINVALALALGATSAAAQSPGVRIDIDAAKTQHRVSRYLTGACIEDVNHEIYGGLYSQMICGESFQEPAPSPTIAGFRRYGGDWLVKDGAILIQAKNGPKLVSEHGPV